MDVQCSLIRELLLYEFKLGHNAAETIKIICCAKGEAAADRSTVTRWLKKFTRVTRTSMIRQGYVGLKP